jgi:hypothetical protein
MAKTTDYETWLSSVDLRGDQDVYDLYSSVNNFEKSGKFYTSKEVTNDGYEYLVHADGVEDNLHLQSDDAKFTFLEYLKANHTDAADNDIQAWYDMRKELGRID